jgi:hypothetical protein
MYSALGYQELKYMHGLLADGFEIGLHCETDELGMVLGVNPRVQLIRDLKILSAALGNIVVKGVAPHRDITMVDNQQSLDSDEWGQRPYGYHAYEDSFFGSGLYVSNRHGNNWNAWMDGKEVLTRDYDFMGWAEFLADRNDIEKIVFLIHPRPWHQEGSHYLAD